VNAELAFFFRHALLRDAAYQLQLPGQWAPLHVLALGIVEAAFGGKAPAPALDDAGEFVIPPHPTDAVAEDLAEHARWGGAADPAAMAAARRTDLARAAAHAERQFLCQVKDASQLERQAADMKAACARAGVAAFE
jgi:hypothetical protein